MTYRFRGYSICNAGTSAGGNLISCFTADGPSSPLNLVRVSSTDTSIYLSWESPYTSGGAAITSYTIYMDSGATPSEDWSLLATQTTNAYNATSLTNNIFYRFKVAASN